MTFVLERDLKAGRSKEAGDSPLLAFDPAARAFVALLSELQDHVEAPGEPMFLFRLRQWRGGEANEERVEGVPGEAHHLSSAPPALLGRRVRCGRGRDPPPRRRRPGPGAPRRPPPPLHALAPAGGSAMEGPVLDVEPGLKDASSGGSMAGRESRRLLAYVLDEEAAWRWERTRSGGGSPEGAQPAFPSLSQLITLDTSLVGWWR